MPSLLERLRQALASRYEVEEEIASGGMATVFRARDLSLQRTVAIKVLRPALATAVGEERFLREARTLASFSHPNLLPIHEVGEAEGLFYYVMDFVGGETLQDRLELGPLSPDESASMARDLLSALEAVHGAGVIHRDVKPGNVFLVEGRALLADFGIAKLTDTSGEPLTGLGQVAGTPGYMSPEQAAGGRVTAKADIYAAGIVIYESRTGRRWSAGRDPSRADWTGVPTGEVAALRHALDPDPEGRWADAASFRRALAPKRSAGWKGRRPGLVAGVLAAAVLVVVSLWPDDDRPPAGRAALLDLAILPCQMIEEDGEAARQFSHALATYVGDIPGLTIARPFSSFSRFAEAQEEIQPEDWVSGLNAENAVRCRLGVEDGRFSVDLEIRNSQGSLRSRGRVTADVQTVPLAAAESAAVWIVQEMGASSLSPASLQRLDGHDIDAVKSFLDGEDAFRRGAHPAADAHYQTALELDSTMTVARWRQADVRRWRPLDPIGVDLQELYDRDVSDLSRLDSLLLHARLQPYGPKQVGAYEEILSRNEYHYDAYATLLYADELYHRGGLWGVPLDSAVAMLDLAVRRDPYLADGVEHLTHVRIRLGQRSEADSLLRHLGAVYGRAEEGVDIERGGEPERPAERVSRIRAADGVPRGGRPARPLCRCATRPDPHRSEAPGGRGIRRETRLTRTPGPGPRPHIPRPGARGTGTDGLRRQPDPRSRRGGPGRGMEGRTVRPGPGGLSGVGGPRGERAAGAASRRLRAAADPQGAGGVGAGTAGAC
jgi:tRNA A-37 threonylcarbamoyl transferase component Bud32